MAQKADDMDETGLEGSLTEVQQNAFHTKVKEALWVYEEIESELRDRVRDYLVDGKDANCLLELSAAYQQAGRKSFFNLQHGCPQTKSADRRKLFGLFLIDKPAPGYYRRLGEVAGVIPDVNQCMLNGDERLPGWLNSLLIFRWLTGSITSYFGAQNTDWAFRLHPLLSSVSDANDIASFVECVVQSDSSPYSHISRYIRAAGDLPEILARHPTELSNALKSADTASRESILRWLLSVKFDFGYMLPALVDFAVDTPKKVRQVALTILRELPNESVKLLEEKLTGGAAGERSKAADAMAFIGSADAIPMLNAALKNESGKRVRPSIEQALLKLSPVTAEVDAAPVASTIELPAIEIPPGELPLPDGFAETLWTQLESAFDKLDQQYEKQLDAYNQPNRPAYAWKPNKPERMAKPDYLKVMNFVSGTKSKRLQMNGTAKQALHQVPNWSTWADLKNVHLVHVVRLMSVFEMFNSWQGQTLFIRFEAWLEAHRRAQSEPYGLRELDAAFATLSNLEHGVIAKTYLGMNNAWRTTLDWEPEAVWPLFAEQCVMLCDAIAGVVSGTRQYWEADRRRTAIKVAGMFPSMPREIEEAVWSVALGEGKSDRPLARKALLGSPSALPRALAAVKDGRQAVRIAGAEFLGELGDESAIDPLKKALKAEKLEMVKGALLQAIEQLGGDVDEFLGRRKQLLDAKKGLEKKRPKGMEWIALDRLPEVRWAEDDKPVASEILQWWIIQSVQFKLPTCGAILRRSVAMCRRDDVAAFAKHLLAEWIAYDTKTPTREEVIAAATKQAKQHWNSQHAQWLQNYYKTEENYRNALADQMQSTFLQSAIGQKGLLAIVSAAGDADCVKMVERFIRTYHGHRLAQSKALLETLAWIEHPAAVQVLLSLGNRFRTKAIRKRAAELVDEIADRQGWTKDQLADRTIPDAGFTVKTDEHDQPYGERPELVLDFGSRKFSVNLDDDLQPVITRDDGKQVKSLPAAAKDDDPELAKAAKKEFGSAKKTIKEVVKNQAERLYEAACVQRSWPYSEWRRYLATHPIAGALCCRVVWAAQSSEGTGPLRLFRPLEDGTLTDVNDEELTLSEDDQITVAHSSLLDAETDAAWKQHLDDYEVPQLFKQFGREPYRLPESLRNETEIADFRGHMLTTFRLRNRATKLGWVRGDAEDGGGFAIYHKPFRREQIDAVVEFTGSYLPESDIPAAIRGIYFIPIQPNNDSAYSWNPNKLKLSKVPPVLVSECYNDVREMAADGTGFDPDWQKKGLW
ncbi:MAG: DUF4132 domain-containing protein [Planctomycetaceae bacterium]|nr:DUF4132 domain-containing protein [Planctomycetaceae bacterium]